MTALDVNALNAAIYATMMGQGEDSALLAASSAGNPIAIEGVVNREEGMRRDARALVRTLSPRELTVVRFLTRGYDLKAIAELLSLNLRSVEVYRTKACQKLGAESDIEVVWFGIYADIASMN